MERMREWFNLKSVVFGIAITLNVLPAWPASGSELGSLPPDFDFTYTICRYLGVSLALLYFGSSCLSVPYRFGRGTVVASLIVMLATSFIECVGTFFGALTPLRSYCCTFLFGLGAGCCFVMWQRVFAKESLAQSRKQIVVASILMPGYFLVVNAPISAAWSLAMLLCLVVTNSVVLFQLLSEEREPAIRVYQPLLSRQNKMLFMELRGYLLYIAVIGFASGVAQSFSYRFPSVSGPDLMFTVGMVLSALILIVVWYVFRREPSLHKFFLVILVVDTVAYGACLLFGHSWLLVLTNVCFMMFSTVSILMLLLCLRVSRIKHLDIVAVAGVFIGLVYSFLLVGQAIGVALIDAPGLEDPVALIAALLLVVTVGSLLALLVDSLKQKEGSQRNHEDDLLESTGDAEETSEEEAHEPSANSIQTPLGQARSSNDSGATSLVLDNERYLVFCRRQQELYQLSGREAEVLELLVRGNGVARIAEILFLSPNTVKTHCRSVYRKMGVHSRQQVVDLFNSDSDN